MGLAAGTRLGPYEVVCLQKEARKRTSAVALRRELRAALDSLRDRPGARVFRRWARRPAAWYALLATVLAATAAFTWMARRRDDVRWARETAIPEIRRLLEDGMHNNVAAYRLATEAERRLGSDRELQCLMAGIAVETSLVTSRPEPPYT